MWKTFDGTPATLPPDDERKVRYRHGNGPICGHTEAWALRLDFLEGRVIVDHTQWSLAA
jgi:hypothetical protein